MDAPPTAPLTAEQQEIRRTLRDLLAERAGPQENRAATATPQGYDPELWARMSGALGLAGLALPEEYGGVGCGPAELALACEETGRALAPSPLLATSVLAAPLLTALGTPEQRAELLPRLADGTLTCALAVPGGSLALALGLTGDNAAEAWSGGGRAGGVQARAVDGGWRLYGEAAQVVDGHSAGLLLVAAHTGGFARSRTLLFLVRAEDDGTPGLSRTRQPTLDLTRTQATVQFRDTPAELLGEEPADVLGALAATGRGAAVMLAAEAVGAAREALDRTVAHVGSREQFGRPVGSFQAVKHRLADLYVQVEAARSLTHCAAREPGPGPDSGPLALAHALEALRATAGESIQLHGGIGFTWEHEAHLFFKRAASDELLFGPVRRLRARAAERTGLFGEVAA
ncbi:MULTISPECIES: acyl-CoA dehydrogenase family protein [Streptomyces]|uniref:Acyl-CoA dehydrogenase n=4 Tax=Streptomyces venezuelae TaxID=54571 RepID=F2R8T4_STRVP|nr:acyl-CoA dehydrogenase family protein [Streptomyces venezuelae]APE22243.1 acyl-CoA dehydrogenase [Streptomyces venezuelae]QER99625.1 acyl-CoA dehydrogenase [Streptomyces venezuelae ATCC 10712]CCA56394.1 acyl-CoA dehydrogenase [Streptomyces venezuelae ATCC 10712]